MDPFAVSRLHALTSAPLHVLFPQLRLVFPQEDAPLTPSLHPCLLQCLLPSTKFFPDHRPENSILYHSLALLLYPSRLSLRSSLPSVLLYTLLPGLPESP